MKKIRLAVNKTDLARLYRNNVGLFYTKVGTPTQCGLSNGSGDLIGFTKRGRFLSCEVKTATGRVDPDQISWLEFVNKWGGYAFVARSVEEALAHVKKANDE